MKKSPSGIRRPLLRKLYVRTLTRQELERIAEARRKNAAADAVIRGLADLHAKSPELFEGLSGS